MARRTKEEIEADLRDSDLRDQFAMAALTGLIAAETEGWCYKNDERRAKRAYSIADAMLNERDRPTE